MKLSLRLDGTVTGSVWLKRSTWNLNIMTFVIMHIHIINHLN